MKLYPFLLCNKSSHWLKFCKYDLVLATCESRDLYWILVFAILSPEITTRGIQESNTSPNRGDTRFQYKSHDSQVANTRFQYKSHDVTMLKKDKNVI